MPTRIKERLFNLGNDCRTQARGAFYLSRGCPLTDENLRDPLIPGSTTTLVLDRLIDGNYYDSVSISGLLMPGVVFGKPLDPRVFDFQPQGSSKRKQLA